MVRFIRQEAEEKANEISILCLLMQPFPPNLDPKMKDADVFKKIQHMVRFIRQEAEEKANEISISAEEACLNQIKQDKIRKKTKRCYWWRVVGCFVVIKVESGAELPDKSNRDDCAIIFGVKQPRSA
ncbi:hypothetical protein L1987_05970 [Smallanthus sonchifolius]|uniref:Uncharacterized protein n=1 Tax=Smallanthus sonchifolius TaxID=185202 RepID=A0ACB9JX10_9ASTR|nr:hypothetical protein L1987_05970 [Smallanthus sonchifolius]